MSTFMLRISPRRNRARAGLILPSSLLLCALLLPLPARAAGTGSVTRGQAIDLRPLRGEVRIDGNLSDDGWRQAVEVDGWLETNPGDNLPSKVANRALLAYDGQYLYAAFEFEDPDPASIRAPLGDRDDVPGYTDYGGLILDTLDDGRTAMMFLANPRGIQYDALTSDAAGEDSSPDFFWDSAARITERGWQLEMRIPFSSLRYEGRDPQMGVLLYRNWPRDFRTQMFASPQPRDEDCFVCHSQPLRGFTDLPDGGSLVVAPYATAEQGAAPRGELGTPLETGPAGGDAGVDVKWQPSPGLTVDATLNPDFSQIESDVPQIAANERFALFFPEKRPFFLEGVDLFDTTIDAVYTRSITQPDWGARATGRYGSATYTLLLADDQGGGSVIIPGADGSSFARQDFASTVAVGRLRYDLGDSFVSFLATERRVDGGGFNRVLGPDFRWRPTPSDTITGQLLISQSETPNRPDLADEWDGRDLSGHAARLWWYHGTSNWDWFVSGQDFGRHFRADNGFVPQVGFREGHAEAGYTIHPESGAIRRLRTYLFSGYREDQNGDLLYSEVSTGFGLNGLWSSFVRIRPALERERSGTRLFASEKLYYTAELSPSRVVSHLELDGDWGDQVDFVNHRPARGGTVSLTATLRPTDHLQVQLQTDRRWLDVDEGAARGRLFTADLARLRAQYAFSSRSYVRLIAEWLHTERDPSLYADEVARVSGGLGGSLLFAYKLNWQTVLFLGYADQRALVGREPEGGGAVGRDERLEPQSRQVFLKLSYAFQR